MIYKKNFLKKVICRIDFDQIVLNKVQDFHKKINKFFPIVEEEKGEEGMINFDMKTKEVKQITNQIVTWNFYNKSRNKKIKIHPTFLYLEYDSYKDSKELIKDIDSILIFVKEFEIKTINRMGLRYINEIPNNDQDILNWGRYINDDIIGSLKFIKDNSKTISRSMGQIVIKEDFGDINLSFGLWNSNFPNEISEKLFVLDFDAYSKYPLGLGDSDIKEIIKGYNQKIETLFESLIKEELRKIMKGEV